MLGKSRYLNKAFRTVGGMGYTGLDHLLFRVKVFGRLHFSGSLAAVASCKADGDGGGLQSVT